MKAESGRDYFQKLPKVELHRHLEGSLRLSTLKEIGRQINFRFQNTSHLKGMVLIARGEDYDVSNFLSKFQVLRQFYRSAEIIERITLEAIEDAAADNIRYLELRFTPVALARVEGFSFAEVMDWVVGAAARGEARTGVLTRLIVSINRHEDPDSAYQVVKLAGDRIPQGIVGLDMAGNEADFTGEAFYPALTLAKEAGLGLTVHAGEWAGAENVRRAIQDWHADRIGHGVRILENPEVIDLARSRNIPFEVCMISNLHTGVFPAVKDHPFRLMLEHGLNVTLNSDDPSIFQATLSDEYRMASEGLGLPPAILCQTILAAARASFLTNGEKARLVESLEKELIGKEC